MLQQLRVLIGTERSGHFQTEARYCRAGPPTRAISCVNPGGQLFLNARGVCGSRGGYIPIERCGGDTEAVRDLSYGNVRISKQRLGGLDIILGEFRGTASGAAKPPRGGKTRLGALTDQTTLEFR